MQLDIFTQLPIEKQHEYLMTVRGNYYAPFWASQLLLAVQTFSPLAISCLFDKKLVDIYYNLIDYARRIKTD